MKSKPMDHSLSVYLDLLRLLAAFEVFLFHANGLLFHREHTFLLSKGRQAVAVFFVLSGFVITFVVSEKERIWKRYIRARAARLYSVTLLAIVVTLAADALGSHLNPGFYGSLDFYSPPRASVVLRYFTFTNQVWYSHAVLGTNEPYWSLGFEASYYALFGILTYLRGWPLLAGAALWFLCVGPNITLYLPIWLLGSFAYRYLAKRTSSMNPGRARAFFALTVVLLLLADRIGHYAVGNMYFYYGGRQEAVLYLFFLLIGAALSLHVVAFRYMSDWSTFFGERATRIIRWFAGASFTLYLVHQPLLVLAACLIPASRTSAGYGVLACCLVFIAVLGLAELGERRKNLFSKLAGTHSPKAQLGVKSVSQGKQLPTAD